MHINEFKRNFRRVKNAWIPRQTKRNGGKGPNATEAKYLREVLVLEPFVEETPSRNRITYQPESLKITRTTGREYTADFLVETNAKKTYHEVKGTYHLPTHERARLAWEIAAETHPEHTFVWAELTTRGWEIERWENGGMRIYVHLATDKQGTFVETTADWRRHKPRKCSMRNGKTKK